MTKQTTHCLVFTLLLMLAPSCRSSKPNNPIRPSDTTIVRYNGTGEPTIIFPEKIKGNPVFIFAKDSKVEATTSQTKLKGSTQSVNTQTASGGSTIGSNDQSGADNSKTKKSATSEAEVSNTAGQGSTSSGDAKATSTNEVGSGSLWWYLLAVGAGFALRHFGPALRRLVVPV